MRVAGEGALISLDVDVQLRQTLAKTYPRKEEHKEWVGWGGVGWGWGGVVRTPD